MQRTCKSANSRARRHSKMNEEDEKNRRVERGLFALGAVAGVTLFYTCIVFALSTSGTDYFYELA